MSFEISTWYDTWNTTGLSNLVQKLVPLGYASRYNLAFGEFVSGANGYTVILNAQCADQVQAQIQTQAPGALVYAGVGDTGLVATVADNRANSNRSTANIVAYLQKQGLQGITIDSEQDGMSSVAELVTQLGPSFKAGPELRERRARCLTCSEPFASVALNWAASSSSSTDRIDHMVLSPRRHARIGVRAAGKRATGRGSVSDRS